MIRVVVAAAFPALRAGLRAMLDALDGIEIVGERSPASLLGDTPLDGVDVLVVDLGENAAATLAALDDALDAVPAVLLAGDPEDFRGALAAGASPRGYLLRDAGEAELGAAVRAVAEGLVALDPAVARAVLDAVPVRAVDDLVEPLTERELEVLGLLALGLPNKGIALRLGISEHTVKFHVGAILAKLGAAGRTEAVMLAARRGLLAL